MKKIILLTLLILSSNLFSQKNKATLIEEMKDYYNSGKIEKLEVLTSEILSGKYDIIDDELKFNALMYSSNIYSRDEFANIDPQKSYNKIRELLRFVKNTTYTIPNKEDYIKSLNDFTVEFKNKHPELKKNAADSLNNTNADFITSNNANANNLSETNNISKSTSEDKTVTLTVSGTGKTLEEAKLNALRSAIEQAFGAFISSKTEILNDNFVKDEIVSVASGNVQKYDILNEFILPSGGFNTTLLAKVSINKLTSFIESKGGTVEFKGGLFSINIKQQILNEKAEEKAVFDMVSLLHETLQTSFDYKIKAVEPVSVEGNNQKWMIRTWIYPFANKNMAFCADYCLKTLTSIGMSEAEVENYKKLKKDFSSLIIAFNGVEKRIFLRSSTSYSILESLANNMQYYLKLYKVNNGFEEFTGNGLFHPDGDDNEFCWYSDGKDEISRFTGIHFYNLGQKAAIIYDEKTYNLDNIEKITSYSIAPLGIKSYFKNGGYVVYEKDGHGLIISPYDIEISRNLLTAKKQCQDYGLYGYTDWFIPNELEIKDAAKNLWSNLLGVSHRLNFGKVKYLYFKKENELEDEYCCVTTGEPINIEFNTGDYIGDGYKFVLRAFRKF